jgi:hypothetical protein
MAKNKFQVRFNLGKGKNYQKWKVSYPDGEVKYLEPTNVVLYMENCKLVNHKGTAQKIYDGSNKTVCAWIEADNVVVDYDSLEDNIPSGDGVSYNPRVTPNWVMNGENVDKQVVGNLITKDRAVYTNK